ncbi:MAG: hypothetical protein ABSD73_08745 [Candidatus Bathyarchaeia archaeon]
MRTKNRGASHKRKKGDEQQTSEGQRPEKPNPRKLKVALVAAASIMLILSISLFLWTSSTTSPQPAQQTTIEVPKAAILDALYAGSQDLAYEQSLTNYLSIAGYRVDVFRGENVTIDLLRNVGGYKVLILRLHSAIGSGGGFLYLFSGEKYTQSKYVQEQLSGAVREAITFDNVSYFAINAVFLGGNNPTGLKDSTIILMGCNGTGSSYSIQRLLDRGVKAYIAWTGYVDLPYSDETTLALVKALYLERSSVQAAVEEAMKEAGTEPLYTSVLECYAPNG